MSPLSTVLFIAGYGLALPLGMRLHTIVSNQQRVAFTGLQVGIVVVILGWLVRGSFAVAIAHLLWLVGGRIWFAMAERRIRNGAALSQPGGG